MIKSSLETVLTYQNEDVVDRFVETYKVSPDEAEEIFIEMKRWLWLCAKRKSEVQTDNSGMLQVPLFNEALAVDLMWHTFLLYTEEYAHFCDHYFGFFIHHKPRSVQDKRQWRERMKIDPVKAQQEKEENLRRAYNYIYDELGPEILTKWCEEFPARFQFKL